MSFQPYYSSMVEVICTDCQTPQTVHIFETPECDECGSRSLTADADRDSTVYPSA